MADARVIKRYANRKLYDTQHSRYVTLDQISEMIRAGEEVQIVDNKTKEDLTTVTLAQIIFEEEKKQRSFMPLGAMRNIIQNGGEWFSEVQRKVSAILPGKRKDGEDDDGAEPAVAPEAAPAPLAEASGEHEPADEGGRRRELAAPLRLWIAHSKSTLDEWQKKLDHRIRTAVDTITPFSGLNKDVRVLQDRIAELEAKLAQLDRD
ncbi:MAG: polyhydroxyalkanoate synthesis regulator DNA-binding domain-containing protein [Kofleriaceae bacterium]|nr:polyhydroxyalkanoate synthesis regulator DNA-binding domain-containing protein [Kofleriaceae bacterium]MBP6836611.1 polyhydroxyalkanoate synthesis regulator DNA-binding domain-containing protein [Kofleriaceae bacterium]